MCFIINGFKVIIISKKLPQIYNPHRPGVNPKKAEDERRKVGEFVVVR